MKNIIFITGIGDLDTDVSLSGYARRFAKALDKNDDEKKIPLHHQPREKKVQLKRRAGL